MTRWYWKATVALALLVSAPAGSEAQVDLQTVLVGKWEGEVQMASGTYPRTLIIKSIRSAAPMAVADAEYGGTGNQYGGATPTIAPVSVAIQAFDNDVILRFHTVEVWAVELTLYKDRRHLFGAMRIPVSLGGVWTINPVKLKKVE